MSAEDTKSFAVWPLVISLASGPIGFGLALVGAANHLPERSKEALGL